MSTIEEVESQLRQITLKMAENIDTRILKAMEDEMEWQRKFDALVEKYGLEKCIPLLVWHI